MTQTIAVPEQFEHLEKIAAHLSSMWPGHVAFVSRNYELRSQEEMAFLNEVAHRILLLHEADLDYGVGSYQKVCMQYMQAEMFYRKEKRYRAEQFDEVLSMLYDERKQMNAYMTGLLFSLLFWWQNSGPQLYFKTTFLPMLPQRFTLSEVGPGHGLATSFTLDMAGCEGVLGLDISEESLDMTRACLERLGYTDRFKGFCGDICTTSAPEVTDAAVISQVLEIVSDPAAAVANLRKGIRTGGLLFVNAPVDFAAPDHIRRWKGKDEVAHFLTTEGFSIREEKLFYPATVNESQDHGYSYVAICEAV